MRPGDSDDPRRTGGTVRRISRNGKLFYTTAEYNRAWIAANIAAGNCRDCKQPRVEGRVRCQKCLDSHTVHTRAWRASVRANAKNEAALRAGADYAAEPESQ